mmetsp:Transcript_39416/g.87706  ORF Transcript_39416/g.87706 Transcript_39416/m.87706 type:complete len:145 (+) Transcript_39416:1498-1932(+)
MAALAAARLKEGPIWQEHTSVTGGIRLQARLAAQHHSHPSACCQAHTWQEPAGQLLLMSGGSWRLRRWLVHACVYACARHVVCMWGIRSTIAPGEVVGKRVVREFVVGGCRDVGFMHRPVCAACLCFVCVHVVGMSRAQSAQGT